MFKRNLILNPWKFGFILIFFSNIIFHASSAFLLLFILFGIFLYVYAFMFYLFNNYADEYSNEILVRNSYAVTSLSSELKGIFVVVDLLYRLWFLYLRLFETWSFNLLNYKCIEFSNNANYIMGAVSDYYEFSALDQISIQNFDSLEQQEFLNKSLGGVQ